MVFNDDKRNFKKPHFSHLAWEHFSTVSFQNPSHNVDIQCQRKLAVREISKLTIGKLIGIRLWLRPNIIYAVLNANQCHGNVRSSNPSDKNQTQTVGKYQLWHSQPYWKYVCITCSIHCCSLTLRFYCQNMLPVWINYARPLNHTYAHKTTPSFKDHLCRCTTGSLLRRNKTPPAL